MLMLTGLSRSAICILVILAHTPRSDGQSRESQRDTTWRMAEVLITAERSGFIPTASISLDRRQLEDRAVSSIGEALRSESGLTLTTGAKAETEFRIRGFPANAAVIMLDGHPLNSGYYDKVDLDLVPAAAVEAITVMKGPTSFAKGAVAMGGIVHIKTRKPRDATYSMIDAEGGGYGNRRLTLQHIQRFESWTANLTLYEQARDAFPLSSTFQATSIEDGDARENSSRRMYGGRLHVEYAVSPGERYSLLLASQEATRTVPPTVYAWDSPTWRRFPSLHRNSASLSVQRDITAEVAAEGLLFYDGSGDNLLDYRNPSFREEDILFDSRIHSQTLGGNIAVRASLPGDHAVHGGVRYRNDMVQRQPHTDREWMTHRYQSASLFVETVLGLWGRGTVTLGLSRLWFSHPTALGDTWKLCPMVGLTYSVAPRIQFTAGASRVLRFPSARQLFSEASGNPDLLPEEAWKVESGLIALLPDAFDNTSIRIEALMHWSELKDLIYRASSAHRFSNISSARLYGAEFRLTARYHEALEFDLSYDHLLRDTRSVAVLRNVAPRILRSAWQYSIGKLTVRHEYGTYDTRETLRSEFPLLPGYSTHSAMLSFRLSGQFRLRVRVNNLFDKDYQEELGYPAAGRSFIAGMTWQR
jgi:outer membrane cobalamin receptor